MNLPRRLLATLLVACVALAACSTADQGSASSSTGTAASRDQGDGAAGTPGTSLTACQILRGSDIEAALDLDAGTAGDGKPKKLAPGDDPAASSCEWGISDWGGLSVNVIPTTGATNYAQAVEQIADRAEPLDIGDGSIWVDDIERGYFHKGSVLVLVQILVLYGGRDKRDLAIALGTAAINRL